MIDFNTEPYNDDFNEDNQFYRILFRPSFAVQARELTQMQSILQNQIKRHGDHIFKEGAMVVPGQASIDTNLPYVKVQAVYSGNVVETYINQLEGLDVVGTSGLVAQVIKVVSAVGAEPTTVYLRYKNSATNTTTKVFANDEVLTPLDAATGSQLTNLKVQAYSTAATGVGSAASIQKGIYYVKGHFVLCSEQIIILDKYTAIPTYRVGLTVEEKILTPEDTGYEMLLDNAQNSYNFAAPGAHRYYIDLTLSTRTYESVDDVDFVELLRVEEGIIKRHVTTTAYSELEKTLARRTFDESGNYTVTPFKIDIREHRSNNRSAWIGNTAYLIGDVVTNGGVTYVAMNSGTSVSGSGPTHSTGLAYDGPGSTGIQWEYNLNPIYNRGVYSPAQGGDSTKLAVGLEPGKAYVQGYEIEKTSTEYVTVNKSRDFVQVDNAVIPATVGNYIIVTNINNLPPVNTFGIVTLYNRITTAVGTAPTGGTAIGTARVRGIEWHNGTIGTQTAQYKLFLFDVKMVSGYSIKETVKSFFWDAGAGDANLNFSADIQPVLERLSGSLTSYTANTYATQGSGIYIQGTGTSFQTDLEVGDLLLINDTYLRRVATIVSQNRIELDSAVNVIGVVYDEGTTTILEPENLSLLFRFPYYAIKSVTSSLGTVDTSYTVYERFAGTTSSASGGTCTLSVSTSSGSFASFAETDNYILVDNSVDFGGSIVAPISATITGSTIQFTLSSTYATRNFIVIGAVNKTGLTLTQKSKTLETATTTLTAIADATKDEIPLGKSDGYRIVSIKMDTGTFAVPTGVYSIDISDRFNFDNGQRDTHYDVARLHLKPSYSSPIAPIQIVYEYFTHSTGDYFTVDSYPANVSYSNIPSYNNTPLRDYIDFRPRISDDGVGFTGAGSSPSLVPKRGIDVRADFTYYLARKTKIAIDFNGNFFAIDGVSSLNPGEPLDPSIGMVLYTLSLEPYTFGTTSTSIVSRQLDNKRYTMRDIGKLDKRIDNLEYYTSLSLLEQQTESLGIVDSDGNDRFKNGFIVDGFSGHNTGDTTNPDYLCSIDMEHAELRPFFSQKNTNLIEKNSNDSQRAASNYQLYGDVITLPVESEIALISQEYASRLENINPFAIFTFLGNVTLTPSTDDWFEVDRRPDLIVEVEGNFSTINTIAEKAGVLGTVWNSWQNQWVGASTTTSESSRNWWQDGGGWTWLTTTTVETTATQIGQSRSGTKTNIIAKIDKQVVNDRVLSTAMIPYIRSRNILVQVQGLKPQTKFYPFFDDVNIAEFCTPASKMEYVPLTGTFDSSTNVGGLSTAVARRINGDSQVCLNRGDIITGQTSGATAVVVGKEYNPDTSKYYLFVHNIIGTFTVSEQILGSVSAAQGTVSGVTTNVIGNNLVTNANGELHLLYNIPNSDSVRFRTGNREFKLIDTSTANGDYTSRGRQMYRAEGVIETRQQTVNSVRNAELVQEQVADNRVIVQTSQRVVSNNQWYDPLAQTFLVQQKGGAFLTKVDIFFATKDKAVPVNLEIREVVNGYPGKLVLPFSRVSINPESVDAPVAGEVINTAEFNTVTIDGVAVAKYDKPTTFNFPSPVYVQDNTEYALVLSSDSNNYKVWISQLGDQIPGSSRTISEQPYMGVFFKSQNASTWTADQTQDLKFTIYRAKFATNTVSNVEFVNDVVPYQTLESDPLEIKLGSTKIRVYQRDHGMPVSSKVTISNRDQTQLTGSTATGTITCTTSSATVTGVGTAFTTQIKKGTLLYTSAGVYIGKVSVTPVSNTSLTLTAFAAVAVSAGEFKQTAPIAGIPVSEIYATHTISDVDLDSYCVTIGTAPTSSGYFGGDTIKATRNVQYDSVHPAIQIQTFPETSTTFGLKTTTGKSVDSTTQVPYQLSSSFNDILANETNNLFAPQMVASEINENTSLAGNKSVTLNVKMSTDNDSLSPILDTQRVSLVLVNNKVNDPTEVNSNVAVVDDNVVVSANATIAFSGSTLYSTNATARGLLKTLTLGKYLNIAGTTSNLNNGTFLITDITDNGTTTTVTLAASFTTQAAGASVTLTQREFYVSDVAPFGSTTYSKYVTKKINLANASSYLRVRFAASIPPEAAVDVYYKVDTVGSASIPFESKSYTKLESDKQIVNVQNGNNSFIDMTYSTANLVAFDSVQVKLVFRSTNSSAVGRVKDLRIIACA